MLHYILQVIIFQLIFLLIYELLLKKETFFAHNRIYLLITPVLAMILPLLKFPVLQQAMPAETLVLLPEVVLGASPGAVNSPETIAVASEENWMNWWWILYGSGAFLSVLLFLKKYRVLKSLFQNPVVSEDNGLKIIRIPHSNLACTFFNTIFLGDRLKAEEVEQIVSHEIVHVRQKHSLDLLFFELLKILFWFNPLIYLYQSRISILHEFIADAGVVEKVEKQTYYQQMLNTAFSTENISFINQFFNHSIIKKRIVMLQKTRSKAISKLKFLIILPLMLAMLTYVSCSDEPATPVAEQEETAQEKLQQIKAIIEDGTPVSAEDNEEIKKILSTIHTKDIEGSEQRVQVQKLTNSTSEIGDVPFSVIEEVPIYPGCEELGNNDARKACMSEKITAFINKNFDTSLGKEVGLTGVNRIYVQFRINKEGGIDILGARAPHPALQEEAKRVVNLLPELIPGKQDGKEVGVLYSLPITFKVGE